MGHLKLTMFSATSLAGADCAEILYDLLTRWEFPPTAFDEYEPIRRDWCDKEGFLDVWRNQANRGFGQVLIRRRGTLSYLAHSILQFGPKVGYHGISVYRIKESECSGARVKAIVTLADEVFARLGMDYGFICSSDEYDKKNILKNVKHADGSIEPRKVVGMNWPKCIPGIYWTNYYGKAYLIRGFASQLSETTQSRAARIGSGIRIQTSDGPRGFEADGAAQTEAKLMRELGGSWFFDKTTERICESIDVSPQEFEQPTRERKGTGVISVASQRPLA